MIFMEEAVQKPEIEAVAKPVTEGTATEESKHAADSDGTMAKTDKQPAKRKKKEAAQKDEALLFGKYSVNGIIVNDQSMQKYVHFTPRQYPNIFGRRKYRSYYNSHINIVERLITKLMRGGTGKKVGGKVIRTEGRLQGKKIKVMHVVEDAFDTISKTGKNPVQVLVTALESAAPIEDTTRVRYGGISYNVAVGISARRRVDVALKNIALSALIGAFKKKKTLSQALADELLLASSKSPDSYAIKKRVEVQRIAKRAR